MAQRQAFSVQVTAVIIGLARDFEHETKSEELKYFVQSSMANDDLPYRSHWSVTRLDHFYGCSTANCYLGIKEEKLLPDC